MDKLKEGIGLRGYGQKNPLIEYKKESFYAFETMINQVKFNIVQRIFKLKPQNFSSMQIEEIESERQKELDSIQRAHSIEGEGFKPKKRTRKKIGRNEPCPCNSGKKYKKCCGK